MKLETADTPCPLDAVHAMASVLAGCRSYHWPGRREIVRAPDTKCPAYSGPLRNRGAVLEPRPTIVLPLPAHILYSRSFLPQI